MQIKALFSIPQNFKGKGGTQKPVLTGIDYSTVDKFTKGDGFKSEFQKAAKEGTASKEMIDRVILDRIPKTIERVKEFVSQNPNLKGDDLTQESILAVVEAANKYKSGSEPIGKYLLCAENRVLEKALKEEVKQETLIPTSFLDEENKEPNEDPVLDVVLEKEQRTNTEKVMDTLTPREKYVVELRYGFLDGEEHTLAEIGKSANITRERARRIEAKALRKLRHPSRRQNLKPYID